MHSSCFLFLSTLSLRRATYLRDLGACQLRISIHALLAESDPNCKVDLSVLTEFLSTLSLRRATRKVENCRGMAKFLSTLSLRRATCIIIWKIPLRSYFYPRSPCGERPYGLKCGISERHFYPRSPCGERRDQMIGEIEQEKISIHALLAESDA